MSIRTRLLLVSTAMVLALAQPAAAQNCLRMVVTASGSTSMWNNEEPARQSAVEAWAVAARGQAGADYASWDAARGKKLSCSPASKSTVRCTASATPCK